LESRVKKLEETISMLLKNQKPSQALNEETKLADNAIESPTN
jgi:hypothetical protein